MALRTYGDKPISFQLDENGEFYCVGSEVSEIYIIKKNIINLYPRLETTCASSEVLYTKNILVCSEDLLRMKNADV